MTSSPSPPHPPRPTPWQQFWIWSGANIAPINWVLGALGITLGLSLLETIAVVALGNLVGCAVFGLFNLMGHRTGVNQMVLGRGAFGRRGTIVPAVVQGLLTMGWVGVNTWVVLDLALAILAQMGVHGGTGLKYLVAGVIMAVQLFLALYGFYAIRTFEKYTVPATVLLMAVMTVLAVSQADTDWTTATAVTSGSKFTAVTQLLTAIGIGWGISWLPYSADYSRFVRVGTPGRSVFWSTALGMYVPTVWLAALGAYLASGGGSADPSSLVTSLFRSHGHRRPTADHARAGRHEHPQPLLLHDRLPARPATRRVREGTGRVLVVGLDDDIQHRGLLWCRLAWDERGLKQDLTRHRGAVQDADE